ncbi:MAG: hypothetical protein K5657_01360 [Desulfovibrio sp.]|nr:hypothetical protein [Desulfovibrio sp.]
MRRISFLCLIFMLFLPPITVRCEEQIPILTRDGRMNLTHQWMEGGGGRLYWRAQQTPLQTDLMGMRWKDPADVPCLDLSCREKKKTQSARRPHKRKAKPARKNDHAKKEESGGRAATGSAPSGKSQKNDSPFLDAPSTSPQPKVRSRPSSKPAPPRPAQTSSSGSRRPFTPYKPVGVPLQ